MFTESLKSSEMIGMFYSVLKVGRKWKVLWTHTTDSTDWLWPSHKQPSEPWKGKMQLIGYWAYTSTTLCQNPRFCLQGYNESWLTAQLTAFILDKTICFVHKLWGIKVSIRSSGESHSWSALSIKVSWETTPGLATDLMFPEEHVLQTLYPWVKYKTFLGVLFKGTTWQQGFKHTISRLLAC